MEDTTVRYGGIDWAGQEHAVCVLDAGGAIIERSVSHSGAELAVMGRRRVRARVQRVAIERPDGPVVDALMAAGLEVVVIPSRQVKALRDRDGSAGSKDDAFDACALADCLRTDGARLRGIAPDSPATTTLRSLVAARKDLVEHRVALANQLRARGAVTQALVAVLGQIREQFTALQARIAEALELHPDGALFTSLPRSGTVRAAALLVEIGDCRERFPTPESLACLAGAAPSTRASGTHRAVSFRWAADKTLRDALIDFAGDSRLANPRAAGLYATARARGKTHPHAERILARSWCPVIWRMWQDRVPYNPNRHGALQRLVATEG